MATEAAPEPLLPLRPGVSDPRFTAGLTADVVEVLVRHGYPRLAGRDALRVELALFRALYTDEP